MKTRGDGIRLLRSLLNNQSDEYTRDGVFASNPEMREVFSAAREVLDAPDAATVRAEAPSDAEVRAHYAATGGGRWLALVRHDGLRYSSPYRRWQEVDLSPYTRTAGFAVRDIGGNDPDDLMARTEAWVPVGADSAWAPWPRVTK